MSPIRRRIRVPGSHPDRPAAGRAPRARARALGIAAAITSVIASAIAAQGVAPAAAGAADPAAGPGLSPAPPARAVPSEPVDLRFVAAGMPDRALSLVALRTACGEREVEVDDPYHARRMRYRALPMRCVLDQGFADRGGAAGIAGQSLLLRARDGYTRPAEAALVADEEAQLAFAEVALAPEPGDPPRFSPIDRRRVDPAPFYLVWTGSARNDPHEHPWPYQLVTIELARFEDRFPHTAPSGLPRADAGWRGYALFQHHCSACHAINGEGGQVGPELNVPKSIVEYRPRAQIRAYVRDPQATRYTSMPSHPGLSDADLDALLAYFDAMRTRKFDARAGTAR